MDNGVGVASRQHLEAASLNMPGDGVGLHSDIIMKGDANSQKAEELAVCSAFTDWLTAAGVVGSGSHSDSIVKGGAYDGALGVIGAIAAMQALRDGGFKPAKPLEAVMFATEEASRFSVPCLGRWVNAAVPSCEI